MSSDSVGDNDPYVVVAVGESESQRTETRSGSAALFKETFDLYATFVSVILKTNMCQIDKRCYYYEIDLPIQSIFCQ